MRAEQIRFAQRGEHREKWLSATDFVAEKLKRMRQRVTDGKTQFAQPERVQKNIHLVADCCQRRLVSVIVP